MTRRPVVVALAALCAVLTVLGLSTASAATLPLNGARLTVFGAADRCTSAVVAAPGTTSGGTSTQVVLTGLGATCGGRAVQLRLWGTAGALAAADTTATLPPTGTSATLTVPTYTVSAVRGMALAIGTWGITTTWAPPVTVPAIGCTVVSADTTKTCAVAVSGGTQWGSPLTDYLRAFEVTTTSTTPVVWQLTFNLSDTTVFPFLAAVLTDQQGGLVLVGAPQCSANPRTVTVRGTTGWGEYHTVVAGQTRGLQVHGYSSSTASWNGQTLLTCS